MQQEHVPGGIPGQGRTPAWGMHARTSSIVHDGEGDATGASAISEQATAFCS